MTGAAKVYCKISFAPHIFPCVDTYRAASNFERLTGEKFTPTEFSTLLVELFGADRCCAENMFRLVRLPFYNRLNQAVKTDDAIEIFDLQKEFDEILKTDKIFQGEISLFEK